MGLRGEVMIKRYGFTILFSLITLVSIIVYYSIMTVNAQKAEAFKIETVSGNSKAVEGFSIIGSLGVDSAPYTIKISQDKAEIHPKSLVRAESNNIIYDQSHWLWKELQEKHKGFMRGKSNINSIYEDSDYVIYVDRDDRNEKFELFLYDKAKDTELEFFVKVPNELGSMYYSEIQNVQLQNQDIIVTLYAEKEEQKKIQQVKMNIKQEKVVEIKTIYETKNEYVNVSFVEPLSIKNKVTKQDYLSFWEELSDGQEGLVKRELYTINFATGKTEKVLRPQMIDSEASYKAYSDNNHIYYFIETTGEFIQYDIQAKQTKVLCKIDESVGMIEKIRNRILLVSKAGTFDDNMDLSRFNIHIFNLETNKIMYEGKIERQISDATISSLEYIDL